jgi:GMP synthase (glutamine-hydrolysing)
VTTELVVLQHHPEAGPSAFVDVLDGRRDTLPWRLVDVPAGDALPAVDQLAGLLVMGGAMGVPDEDQHPWMEDEMALLRRTVEAEVPVFGVCLGAQLLGAALGGKVERRVTPEIGYLPLERTEEGRSDEVIAGWPDGAATLMLHEDQVTSLPDGAQALLCGSDGWAAWRVGTAHAVQFHPEVTAEQLATWVALEQLAGLLDAAGVDPEELTAEARRRARFTVPQGRALVGRWLDGPVRKHAAG